MKKISRNCLRFKSYFSFLFALGSVAIGFGLPVLAAPQNPLAEAEKLVASWLKPVFYIGLIVFGALLVLKRRFTELFGFLGVALVAVAFIFYPDKVTNFLGSIVDVLIK